jgi:hypothetical protein
MTGPIPLIIAIFVVSYARLRERVTKSRFAIGKHRRRGVGVVDGGSYIEVEGECGRH